ncbi:MAG: N-acetyltransferase [Cyanobacteria bacterium P01_C01_bin.118]
MRKEKFNRVVRDAAIYEFVEASSEGEPNRWGQGPKISYHEGNFKAPDGSDLEVVVKTGWSFILQHYNPNQFYTCKIDGPDHGLIYDGPWPGFAWEVMFPDETMDCIIRPLELKDEPFLWEMLYQAIYIPEGQATLPRKIVQIPELARYVQDWGRKGDGGFLSGDTRTNEPIGAVWLRLPIGEYKGYGYVDDETAELSIAVLPEYRGKSIGTQLLTHLFASKYGQSSISLSVSVDNPAVWLYERFGFEIVGGSGQSLTMKRN